MTIKFVLACLLVPAFSFAQLFTEKNGRYELTTPGATNLASLPLQCISQQFPYKSGIVYSDATLITRPKEYHPVFYGCFDWHSSAHGHWMLIRLLRQYPLMQQADTIRTILKNQLTADNIARELRLFQQKENKSFERTYGWAWILQMQKELIEWNDPLARELSQHLMPLSEHFARGYIDFLGKILYPIRVGEHSNLAFGLRLAWDYAEKVHNDSLKNSIRNAALKFYKNDAGCPIGWEPGGTDFLSPCLEEADLMWRILSRDEYEVWLKKFLPSLFKPVIDLKPGEVKDRTDGRLVHLDGLNFSRAWCLYGIASHVSANRHVLLKLANKHMAAALPHVASGDYMGEHWLASFAVYALTMK